MFRYEHKETRMELKEAAPWELPGDHTRLQMPSWSGVKEGAWQTVAGTAAVAIIDIPVLFPELHRRANS